MRRDKTSTWLRSFGETALCVLVLAACMTGCFVSCKSTVRDLGCQMNGGDVVLSSWSFYNGCTLDADAGAR